MIQIPAVDRYPCEGCQATVEVPNVVVSRGSFKAPLMIIGEAPGASEDKETQPFVGRSGKLLDEMLISSDFDIEQDVYMCNVVKCRPPKNRRPTKLEIEYSLPWLYQQIALVDPLVVALTGSTALESVIGMKDPISSVRGKWLNWNNRLVMPLFHPAYLLRNPSRKELSPYSLTKKDLFEIHNKLKTIFKSPSMRYSLSLEAEMKDS